MEVLEEYSPDGMAGQAAPLGRVFLLYNTARWMYRFRLPLMRALREQGYEVVAVSPPDEYVGHLEAAGFSHVSLELNRKGTNPVEDLGLAYRLNRLFRLHRPDLVLTFTVKPNVYGSLAARPLGIPVINTIPGLGSLFVQNSLLTSVARFLYRMALHGSDAVVFQNGEDRDLFIRGGLVRPEVTHQVPGSGVDTTFFAPGPEERNGGPFVFLFAGRFLWAKGLAELVEAVRLLRSRDVDVELRLLGFFEPEGTAAVPPEQMAAWEEEGVVTHLGEAPEVADHMRAADCIVLPSYYREGLPRTLLEAGSLEKPVIAADATGSRDLVRPGRNGFLCRPGDPGDLAEKMHAMIRLPETERRRMGREGREIVCREYDERIVVDRYMELVDRALARRRHSA
jgi:glycosyltransferase involved in cell wall biosynthesis